MLSSDHNTADATSKPDKEMIIDKHSRTVFLIPVAVLLFSVLLTFICADRRIIGAFWIISGVMLYHFVIEHRELYYYLLSQNGIIQYNIFTSKQRVIPWSQITQIGIRKGGRGTGGMLVITILGAPKWNPSRKSSGQTWYYLSNRPNVLILEKWRQAQAMIQTFYGPLDY